MASFTPVDHDPFSTDAPKPEPKMVPVDHDPFNVPPNPPLPGSTGYPALDTADAFVRSAANSATFGLADKLAGLVDKLKGVPDGQKYENDWSEKDRSTHPVASIAGDVAGAMAPAMGTSNMLSRAVPMLARPTVTSIAANAAATGGIDSAADDAAHGRIPDPLKAGISAGVGGAGGATLGGVAKLFSPGMIVRGAGAGLTDADKSAMSDLAQTGKDFDIPLNMRELADATAPGRSGGVAGTYHTSTNSPGGSIADYNFNRGRTPTIREQDADPINQIPKIRERLDSVLGAISPANRQPFIDLPDHGDAVAGPTSKAWQFLTDATKSRVTRAMQNPDNIPLLGQQHAPTQAGIATMLAAFQAIRDKNYDKFNVLSPGSP